MSALSLAGKHCKPLDSGSAPLTGDQAGELAKQLHNDWSVDAGYNRCLIRYNTHSVGGLSENDFICCAKIDALLPAIS
jgi:pterin-4a-carbinolamine dehydratase